MSQVKNGRYMKDNLIESINIINNIHKVKMHKLIDKNNLLRNISLTRTNKQSNNNNTSEDNE